jgi:3-oxoacyl-[acyl-carrier-protein] synthase II
MSFLRINLMCVSGPRIKRRCMIVAASSVVSAPKRETDPKKRVVITGMGIVSCFGNDVDTFYDSLLEGKSGVSYIDRFNASNYSTTFAGQIRNFSSEGYIDGKNDRRLDDCLRYGLVSGKRALEHADLGGEKLDKVFSKKKNKCCFSRASG